MPPSSHSTPLQEVVEILAPKGLHEAVRTAPAAASLPRDLASPTRCKWSQVFGFVSVVCTERQRSLQHPTHCKSKPNARRRRDDWSIISCSWRSRASNLPTRTTAPCLKRQCISLHTFATQQQRCFNYCTSKACKSMQDPRPILFSGDGIIVAIRTRCAQPPRAGVTP